MNGFLKMNSENWDEHAEICFKLAFVAHSLSIARRLQCSGL